MSRRVLVTGGAGFYGAHIIRYLLCKYPDYQIINFDSITASASLSRLAAEENNPLYTFYEGDITNEADVQYVFEQYKPDYVLHFASQSYIDKNIHQPSIFIKTNVIGTQLLLINSRESNVKKMIQLSTSKVYGSLSPDTEITEESRLQPYGPYAASKAAADLFVAASYRAHKINVNIIRPTNIYGSFQFPEKLIPTIIDSMLKGKGIPVFGDGSASRDWIHVSDFCRAVDLVLHQGVAGETYNVSSGKSHKNIEVVRKIINLFGGSNNKLDFLKERLGDETYPAISSKKLINDLGWQQQVDFNKGLETTIEWYKYNTAWIDEIHSKMTTPD